MSEGTCNMNNSRLPFTVVQSFRELGREPRTVPFELSITDAEICWICGGMAIVVATICGAFLGFYL